MPARALTTASLVLARARARGALLVSAAAGSAIAVATLLAILASLARAGDEGRDAAPAGLPADEVAEQVAVGVAALWAAAPALVLLVLVFAVTAVSQLGRLLALARARETENARARGLDVRQRTAADALEAAGVAASATVAGFVLAAATAALLWGSTGLDTVVRTAWSAPLTAIALGAVLVFAQRRPAELRGRGARVAGGTAVSVVVLAAAFVIWQLPRARAGAFDPVVAIAPSVVLLAGAVVALAAFATLSIGASVASARGRSVSPSLPARQVARRLAVTSVAVLMVTLTIAQLTFASAYAATWTASATDEAAVRAGADLRVELNPSAADPEVVAIAAAVPGIARASAALVVPIELGDIAGQLVAVPGSMIEPVVSPAGGAVDPAALAAAVAPGEGDLRAEPVPLGERATGLRVIASVASRLTNAPETLQLTATLLDAAGTPAALRLVVARSGAETDVVPDGTAAQVPLTAEAPLPRGTGPWSLIALTAAVPARFSTAEMLVEVDSVDAVGGDELDIAATTELGEASERVLWVADGAADTGAEPAPVRAAVGAELAERLSLETGDVFEFRYTGSGRRGQIEVGAVVATIPGAPGIAFFAPLDALTVSNLQRGTSFVAPNSLWAAGDTAADADLSAALDDRPVVTAAPSVAASVVGALVPGWLLVATGCALLGLLATSAIVQTLSLDRRSDAGVLRALGLTSRRLAAMRAGELSAVLAVAVIAGVGVGVAAAALAVPSLVAAATPGGVSLAGGVQIDGAPLAVTVGAFAVGLAGIVAWAARSVSRTADGATVGEDAR